MAFGFELKRLREEAGWSVQKLADKIGVDAERMRQWERNGFTPRADDREVFEAFFNMSLEEIEKLASFKELLKVPKKKNPAIVNDQDQKDLIIQLQAEIIKLQRDKASEVEKRLSEMEKDLTLIHSTLVAGSQVVYESVLELKKNSTGKPENTFHKRLFEIVQKQQSMDSVAQTDTTSN